MISVEGLSKRYLVGHRERGDVTFRDTLVREMHNAVRKAADVFRGRQVIQGDTVEEFWALKGVNFEIREGEVVGIIGRNGAGKSTLLKILSRITEPTAGRVTLRGRVASLLEVGTGFHPELSGRENIYLNGAILGMNRVEIRKKFDEIVAFADIERFLDTPVKRYSSGMYVRLAFAVAAHLEPEILIVDEVLAVGDAEFQKKCLGKMEEVSRRQGRTVLFVSHNLAAVGDLAHRTIYLSNGSVVTDAPTHEALAIYLSAGGKQTTYVSPRSNEDDVPHVAQAEIITSDPNGLQHFGEPLSVRILLRHRRPLKRGCFALQIVNQFGQPIVHAFAYHPDVMFGQDPGESELVCHFPNLRLNVGEFHIRTHVAEPPGGEHYESVDDICHFEVVRTDQHVLWGWRSEVCTYQEEFHWDSRLVDQDIPHQAVRDLLR